MPTYFRQIIGTTTSQRKGCRTFEIFDGYFIIGTVAIVLNTAMNTA